jgi:hypothetical protein
MDAQSAQNAQAERVFRIPPFAALLCMTWLAVACSDDAQAVAEPSKCANAEPLFQSYETGEPAIESGIERCDGDSFRRVAAVKCEATFECRACGDAAVGDSDDAGAAELPCCEDATEIDDCAQDSDCASGEACLCSAQTRWNGDDAQTFNTVNRCVPATCASDDDCGGLACAITTLGCGFEGMHCRTRDDACETDADCDRSLCAFDGAKWACLTRSTCE